MTGEVPLRVLLGFVCSSLILGCSTKEREFGEDSGSGGRVENGGGRTDGGPVSREDDAGGDREDPTSPVESLDADVVEPEPAPPPLPEMEPEVEPADAGEPEPAPPAEDASMEPEPASEVDSGLPGDPDADIDAAAPEDPDGDAGGPGTPCLSGGTRSCAAMGALGNCAEGYEECVGGTWSGVCSIEPGANDTCALDDDADCDGVPNEGCACIAGAERSCAVGGALGNCATGTQTCGVDGTFGPCDVQPTTADLCDVQGDDANCDGVPNGDCTCLDGATAPCGPATDVGLCQRGTVTCTDGQWSATCVGAVHPAARNCGSAMDADCDGVADNTIDATCQCVAGTVAVCGEHPGFDQYPQCSAGEQTCTAGPGNSSTSWGPCVGSVGPAPADICVPGDDSNCNGIENEGCRVVCSGDYTVSTPSQLASLVAMDCQEITGNLTISNLATGNLSGLVVEEVGGNLTIANTSLLNLTGLNSLASIGGYLALDQNASLGNISALGALRSIGDGLSIDNNDALPDLVGLEQLSTVPGSLNIGGNPDLQSLDGLDGLTSVGGNVWIDTNGSLASLEGLNDLQSVGGYLLIDGAALTSLSALSSLRTIGGYLHVQNATGLSSLAGLGGITSISGALYLYYLDSLTSLAPLTSWSANVIGGGLYLGFLPNVCQSAVLAFDAQMNASCAYCENNDDGC